MCHSICFEVAFFVRTVAKLEPVGHAILHFAVATRDLHFVALSVRVAPVIEPEALLMVISAEYFKSERFFDGLWIGRDASSRSYTNSVWRSSNV